MSGKKRSLDVYLEEVSKQVIFIKDDDYKKSQQVFNGVFEVVKTKMKEQCNYFGKYSNQVMHAGSVYDGLKVSKLDEFDMDIVIRLPINYDNGIALENDLPGFVKLKIEAFDYLDKQPDWEKCHKVTRDWRDTEKYFLQNKFRSWLHGIVSKALNDLDGRVTVNDITYLVTYKEAGPAYTLNIENDKGNDSSFKLDVDLVPVIRFRHPRWPEGYRQVEGSNVKDWLVVPKPNKAIPAGTMKNRCWRLSFQEYEREMLKDCNQLKTTIRLVKKLRDSLQMKEIASYYIKTLFLWKIDEIKEQAKGDEKEKNKYWQKGLGTLFHIMVKELYEAIKEKNIRYFWHSENNLIEKMKPTIQKLYVDKLKVVIDAIEANEVDKVISSLLTVDEFQEFKKSDFYQKQLRRLESVNSLNSNAGTTSLDRQDSVISLSGNPDSLKGRDNADSQSKSPDRDVSLAELVKVLNAKIASMNDDQKRFKKIEADAKGSITKLNTVVDILKEINNKVDSITEKVDNQNERLKLLETGFSEEKRQLNDKIEMLLDKIDIQNERLKTFEKGKKYEERYCEVGSALADTLEIDRNGIRLSPQNTKPI